VGQLPDSRRRPGLRDRKHAGPYFAARAAGISKDLVESERTAKEAEARAAEVDRRLAGLEVEIAALRAESQKEAAAETERYAQQTTAEIAKIGANGEQEIRRGQKPRASTCSAMPRSWRWSWRAEVRARMDPDTEDRLVGASCAASTARHKETEPPCLLPPQPRDTRTRLPMW
jgi:hypothetical protein